MNVKKLIVLAEDFEKKLGAENKGQYGGKGPFKLPETHMAAMVLESGTFSCANCKFVDAEKHECSSPHYIKWNGGSKKLPDAPLEKICSDWFDPKI
jgi:hypothetical protein